MCNWLQEQGYEVWCSLDLLPQDELDAKCVSSQDSDKSRVTKDDAGDFSSEWGGTFMHLSFIIMNLAVSK